MRAGRNELDSAIRRAVEDGDIIELGWTVFQSTC